MSRNGIPEAVQQFIFEHIDSIEQLEVLLYLRAHRETPHTAQEISQQLRTNATSVMGRLRPLIEIGLIKTQPTDPASFQYAPSNLETVALLDDLAEAFKVRKQRIFELVYSPLKRARSFAKAFIVASSPKKDGGEDG